MDKVPPLAILGPIVEPAEVLPEIAGNITSLDFLQAIYRDGYQTISLRMRAAIEALPFEHPKLAVTASLGPNSGFAARLEAAIARTRELIDRKSPMVINAEPADQSSCD